MNSVEGASHPARLAGVSAMDVLHTYNVPVVVIGDDSEVRWTSPGAERWLCAPLPVFLQAGRLRFDDRHRRYGIAGLRTQLDGTERRQILLGDPSGSNWVIIAGWLRLLADKEVLITTYRMAHPLRQAAHSGLAEQFRLTPTQCAVIDLFAHMLPPRDIADTLGLTVHTVRSHFKTIHAKTGVKSSMQLLQLVRAFCDA
jgi:DNA-binding CsgD family transcriptional regulator